MPEGPPSVSFLPFSALVCFFFSCAKACFVFIFLSFLSFLFALSASFLAFLYSLLSFLSLLAVTAIVDMCLASFPPSVASES